MRATSGLSAECLPFVGRRLEVRFEHGWGWRVLEDFGKSSHDFEEIHQFNGNTAEVVPTKFCRHYGVLRAFKAHVVFPAYSLHGMEVLAFTLADGFDWNFSTRVCSLWGFLFGQGEPQFPFWKSPYPWPMIFKSGTIVGFGSDMREVQPINSTPPVPSFTLIP